METVIDKQFEVARKLYDFLQNITVFDYDVAEELRKYLGKEYSIAYFTYNEMTGEPYKRLIIFWQGEVVYDADMTKLIIRKTELSVKVNCICVKPDNKEKLIAMTVRYTYVNGKFVRNSEETYRV